MSPTGKEVPGHPFLALVDEPRIPGGDALQFHSLFLTDDIDDAGVAGFVLLGEPFPFREPGRQVRDGPDDPGQVSFQVFQPDRLHVGVVPDESGVQLNQILGAVEFGEPVGKFLEGIRGLEESPVKERPFFLCILDLPPGPHL